MHPTIAQALAPFVPAPESLEVAAYRARLRRFDWQFEFSDDARTVREARAELEELRALRCTLDPMGDIWRAVAPQGHGVPSC